MNRHITHRKTFASPRLPFCVLFVLLLFFPFYHTTQPAGARSEPVQLTTVQIGETRYLSLNELSSGNQPRIHPNKNKAEFKIGEHTCVVTLLSSWVVINGVSYNLPARTTLFNGVYHVPAELLLQLLPNAYQLSRQETKTTAPVTFRSLPPPAAAFTPRPEVKPDPKRWTLRTIVIDPGHGGKDPGAIGPGGTFEKDIALKVAKRLKPLLEKQLRVNVILTRSDDTFIPLGKRAEIARKSEGKIFVSLHCNATRNRKARGWEIYFLSEAKTDAAAEVARQENAVLELEEHGTGSDTDTAMLQNIVSGLHTSQFLKESQELAAMIRTEVDQRVQNLDDRGVKQANFYVMCGTMGVMPSVFLELGFISNPTEEKRMRSTAFQKQMAESIVRGIKNFKRRYEQQLVAKQ